MRRKRSEPPRARFQRRPSTTASRTTGRGPGLLATRSNDATSPSASTCDPQLDAREAAARPRAAARSRRGRRGACDARYRGLARPHGDPGRLDATRGGVARNSSGGPHERESITSGMPRNPESLAERLQRAGPLVLDGATGTELERRGVATQLPLWSADALLRAPALVERDPSRLRGGRRGGAHREHLPNPAAHAGAASGLGDRAAELTALAVRLAREACANAASSPLVLGSDPPLEDCYRPDLVPDDAALASEHAEHCANLAAAGVDAILCETHNSAARGVRGRARRERDRAARARELRLLGGSDAALGRAPGRRRARPCGRCARQRCW